MAESSTADRISQAALAILETEGPEAVSMRRRLRRHHAHGHLSSFLDIPVRNEPTIYARTGNWFA